MLLRDRPGASLEFMIRSEVVKRVSYFIHLESHISLNGLVFDEIWAQIRKILLALITSVTCGVGDISVY